jgi:hypothetical protein
VFFSGIGDSLAHFDNMFVIEGEGLIRLKTVKRHESKYLVALHLLNGDYFLSFSISSISSKGAM